MANLCLESMWSTRLRCLGWSSRAAKQTIHSLADSTLSNYKNQIRKYVTFCEGKNINFADNTTTANIAEFLCWLTDHSDRPESVIKTALAAIDLLFYTMGLSSPTKDKDIDRLVTALIKSGTTQPMKRQRPMPIDAFVNLFENLGSNTGLSLGDLRMKAITLLALCAMTRPSDLAPKGKVFRVEDRSTTSMAMRVSDITFEQDGTMTVCFHGIKNDTNRQGFEVNIPQNAENPQCDPVDCLKVYIERTQKFRSKDCDALFLTLRAPFHAISADTVANIMEDAIKKAGLQGLGFTAKSFRPTGATNAVNIGILPETVMKIGRWKTQEVFLNHYVYGKVPRDYSARLLK